MSQLISKLSPHQLWLLLAFIALKIALIFQVPLTGDEAYFIVWGQQLSLGYYDHPPMVGWVLYFLSSIADHLIVYRLFAFVAAVVIAYLLYQTLRLHPQVKQDTAFYVAMAFFVSPISLIFVVTANDTVLVFFSVVAFYFFAKALAQPSLIHALLAGLFLGLAFLSKYFAAFMLVGLFLYSLVYIRQYSWKWLVVMTSVILLFVAENLYFNATHCWNNILFNFFSRTTDSAFDIGNVLTYIAMIIGLMSPLGLYYLIKNDQKSKGDMPLDLFKQALFATVPLLLILLLVSFTNPVGLHWPLIAVTILYILYVMLSEHQLEKLYLFNAYSSLLIGVAILLALVFVNQLISPSQKHHVAVYTQPEAVCEQLPKTTFFTLGYSGQSALSYHCKNDDVHVFMSKSKFGREDDKKTDFKALNDQSIEVFVTHQKYIERVSAFFSEVDVKELVISDEVTYYLVKGNGFNYPLYREQILKPVNDKFYTAPEWFPDLSDWLGADTCQFKSHYDFPA